MICLFRKISYPLELEVGRREFIILISFHSFRLGIEMISIEDLTMQIREKLMIDPVLDKRKEKEIQVLYSGPIIDSKIELVWILMGWLP